MDFKPLRSFVRREGRITPAQREACEELLPVYGWPPGRSHPRDVFGRDTLCVLEIGFGNGDNLLRQAAEHPDRNFIGLEVHRPGVGSLLRRAQDAGLQNLRVATEDAMDFLATAVPPASLDVIQLFFPDPWPKKRHHKRRLVRAEFLDRAAISLRPGGTLLLATDWENYAEQMQQALDDHDAFEDLHPGTAAPRADRVMTRFEKRGLDRGHRVRDFAWRRR